MVSVTHLILRFAIVQSKFQQTNKTKINYINDNHIKFEVSLHFWRIWPTVRHDIIEKDKLGMQWFFIIDKAVKTKGAEGQLPPPPFFERSINPISTVEQNMSTTLLLRSFK